jgi:hypothetical protein
MGGRWEGEEREKRGRSADGALPVVDKGASPV